MKIEISNHLHITGCPEKLRTEICSRLTFINPKWQENERMGRWQGDTPRLLRFYKLDSDGTLIVPRGFVCQLPTICNAFGASYDLADQTRELPPVQFEFAGGLRNYQEEAVNAMSVKRFGTLEAPTGSGKTVMALSIIAKRRQPALIVAHTKELLNQWVDQIKTFLGIDRGEIGVIGNGKQTIGERITVALVQSLYKCAPEVAPHIGHLIVDECHRTPSRTFTEAVTAFDCKYMLGLSATPYRRDKLSRLIFWYIGDIRHRVNTDELVDNGSILRAEVVTRQTDFKPFSDPSAEYSRMLSELTEDEQRNRLIASDIAREAGNGGGICIALSDRKSHCERLRAILQKDFSQPCDVLTGDLSATKRQALVERLNAGDIRVLIATGQLIGEGFDCKELSTLFLATPIRFSGRVQQYLGRVMRPAPGKKKARIYDYIDHRVGPLLAAAQARQKLYNLKGF